MQRCAAEIGIEAKLYGVEGKVKYAYMLRQNEGCSVFLNRLGRMEGVAIKSTNGAIRAVSIKYAQDREAAKKLYVSTAQDGDLETQAERAAYTRQKNKKYTTMTVISPFARVTAYDSDVERGNPAICTTLPATDAVIAGRWARGLLLMHNREQEKLQVRRTFIPSMSALLRVDVEGTNELHGVWIVDEVEQDLLNETTNIDLVRVINTIR